MHRLANPLLPLTVGLLAVSGVRAQFAETFDSQATADVTVISQPDCIVSYVDYTNMTVGSQTFALPEAPRPIAGGAPGRGVLVQCNVTQTFAAGVNILAGSTPVTYSGRHRLSFDAWSNVPVPLPNGSTEQLLWGVGVDGDPNIIEARNNRGGGTQGVYGWLAGENGYGTEDAAINEGDLELCDLGDLQPGEDVPFNAAFDSNSIGGPNGCAANTWVRVDIDVDDNGLGVRVYYNGVEFFGPNANPGCPTQLTNPVNGYAMIGFEDPFSSLGSNPDAQWCVLDNFRVVVPTGCGTAGVAAQQGTASAGEILNGGGPPAIGAPLTTRLRGGPVSSVALLAVGSPSPVTIPLSLGGGCTLNVELALLDGIFTNPTNADGGAIFTIDVPANTAFCGGQLGFQYLWLDPANPSCPFQLTQGLAVTIGS